MWVAILGASSSGKEAIASLLKKRDFIQISSGFNTEKPEDYFVKSLAEHLEAQSLMFDKDIFTYRTFFDSFEVMTKNACNNWLMTKQDFDKLEKYYNLLCGRSIQPPNVVIYTKMELKDIQNRCLLQGRRPNDEEIKNQIELYDEFISRVRVPKIEINMSNSPELVAEELNYGIDSIKSMVLTQKTIWQRAMFY